MRVLNRLIDRVRWFRRRGLSLVWFMSGVLLAASSCVADTGGDRFAAFSDDDTAALWLFDEPLNPPAVPMKSVTRWYYTQTLTDASDNHYDLHRLHGGAIVPGRFGNALRIDPARSGGGMNLPANYATVARTYGVFLPADHEFAPGSDREAESVVNFFWYTHPPDQLLGAVAGDQWTVELWVRFASPPGDRVTLIDAGQGWDDALRVELIDGGKVTRLVAGEPGIDVRCDAPADTLADGGWHHMAWVKPDGKNEVRLFVDGQIASTSAYIPDPRVKPTGGEPGLIARVFSDATFDQPTGEVRPIDRIDADWSDTSASGWSARLRGWVRAPYTGRVRFSTDADNGMHLGVNHRPLIYGWFGRAAIYKRSPRWGEVEMTRGELYPVLIEFAYDPDNGIVVTRQNLYWSWDGHSQEPVPASAWVYTQADQDAAGRDSGGGLGDTDALMALRFNLTLGSDRRNTAPLDGWLDEVRVSSVARYGADFAPTTHALNHGADAPPAATPTGPAPLFAQASGEGPLPLGGRKHVFIDDALIAESRGIEFVVNPPSDPVAVDPPMPHGDHSAFDWDGRVGLFAPAGYEGREDYAYLWLSDDGVRFRLLGADNAAVGSRPTPTLIDTGVPAWGRMAIDTNPNTPGWARFKFTAGVPHRGVYLLVSPDAIHWRRNETIMAQVGTGGEAHWYWDDQVGKYRCLLKWDHGPGGRQAVEMTTDNPFAPWPLSAKGDPERDLASPLGYLPTRFPVDERVGEVYRTRADKYPWAPDTYVAFIWRYNRVTQARQVELAVSRDGLSWTHYGEDWYMPAEFRFGDQMIHEVTSVAGLIRRGDEIWQYADYSTGRHDSSAPHTRVRLTQRLDGFVALKAGSEGGTFTTRELAFTGDALSLNVDAGPSGEVRVAVLTGQGEPIQGYGLEDCDPIRADSTGYRVTWRSGGDLADLAGRPVRLQFQLRDARLYAFQFVAGD